MRFFPYKKAPFVTKVKEAPVIGVMAGADKIAAHVFDDFQIAYHCLWGDGAAELGMIFMAVETPEPEGFSVKEYPAATYTHFTETDPLYQVILLTHFIEKPGLAVIETGIFRMPLFYPRGFNHLCK